MAFVTPTNATVGSVLTASKYNQEVVDNTQTLFDTLGLTLIERKAANTASSISFDNVFTTLYLNYLVKLNITSFSASNDPTWRYRNAGSDVSTALYAYKALMSSSNGSTIGEDFQANGRTQTSASLLASNTSAAFSATIEIHNPQIATETIATTAGVMGLGNLYRGAFAYNASTTFDGFSIISSSGTFNYVCSVYGYKGV